MPTNIDYLYVISQIAVLVAYGFLAWSYLLKTQKNIIIVGFASLIFQAIAFFLLGAWTGLLMCAVAAVRNLVRWHAETKGSSFGTSKPFFILVLLLIAAVTVPFYDGFLSLMSVFATSVYSYSVWQKKPSIYKLCGIPVGILWTIYNLFIGSLFAWILEAALLVFVIVGIIKDWRQGKLNESH